MQRSEGVAQAIQRMYDAFTANDLGAFTDLITEEDDTLAIGTAPHEWHVGRAKWLQEFGMPGIQLRGGDIVAWEEGSIGWLADRPTFVLPDGSELQVRMTCVLRKERGDWRLVQLHASIPITDEEATGQEWTEASATEHGAGSA